MFCFWYKRYFVVLVDGGVLETLWKNTRNLLEMFITMKEGVTRWLYSERCTNSVSPVTWGQWTIVVSTNRNPPFHNSSGKKIQSNAVLCCLFAVWNGRYTFYQIPLNAFSFCAWFNFMTKMTKNMETRIILVLRLVY